MRRGFLVLCLLSATACLGRSPAAPTAIDRTVVLAPGQTVHLATDVTVGFVAVLGDSRCPINAICVWAGDATVRVTVSSSRTSGERDLNTATKTPLRFEDLDLSVVELQPYPFAGHPTEPGDYRATLHVRR